MHEDKPTTRCKGSKTILEWNMGNDWHNRKAEWINSKEKELLGLYEVSKVIIHLEAPRATQEKYLSEKLQAMMADMDFGFKNSHLSTME